MRWNGRNQEYHVAGYGVGGRAGAGRRGNRRKTGSMRKRATAAGVVGARRGSAGLGGPGKGGKRREKAGKRRCSQKPKKTEKRKKQLRRAVAADRRTGRSRDRVRLTRGGAESAEVTSRGRRSTRRRAGAGARRRAPERFSGPVRAVQVDRRGRHVTGALGPPRGRVGARAGRGGATGKKRRGLQHLSFAYGLPLHYSVRLLAA